MVRGATPLRTDYAEAGMDRLDDARTLLEQARYGGAIYLAGRAIESMLKAFIDRRSETIKGHNLATLARDANMTRRIRGNVREAVDAAITESSLLWRNLFRYSSVADYERMAREMSLTVGVDGRKVRLADFGEDALRHWAETIYEHASLVVQEGKIVWDSRKR